MNKSLTTISKFLSYILRHQPEAIGLKLDSEGWVNIDDLILASAQHGKQFYHALIQAAVDTSDKSRFAISDDGLRIRAVQGHSSQQVDINYQKITPPPLFVPRHSNTVYQIHT